MTVAQTVKERPFFPSALGAGGNANNDPAHRSVPGPFALKQAATFGPTMRRRLLSGSDCVLGRAEGAPRTLFLYFDRQATPGSAALSVNAELPRVNLRRRALSPKLTLKEACRAMPAHLRKQMKLRGNSRVAKAPFRTPLTLQS